MSKEKQKITQKIKVENGKITGRVVAIPENKQNKSTENNRRKNNE